MSFKTDNGGLAVKANIKVSFSVSASSWNTRLSQIKKQEGEIFICTYSLPDINYVRQIFEKRTSNISLLVNSKFTEQAKLIKKEFPEINIMLAENTHAKIVLISPDTVWLSSANFGKSSWFENTVGIKNEHVYKFYQDEIKSFILKNSVIVL